MFIKSRFSAALRNAVFAISATVLAAAPVAAQSADSGRLKTAIVFNILRFVDFPDGGRGPINFCVATRDSSGNDFRAISGRTAGSRTVSVRMVSGNGFSGCDVVYLGSANSSAVANASSSGRLVIGDGTRFIDRGGAVGLVQTGNQVRFEINLDAARASDVQISSRLIRLAARVRR